MAVTIRPGTTDDFTAAADLYFVATTERRDGRPVEDWRMAEVRQEIANPEAWLFMAEDDGVPVAMASAMPSRGDKSGGELVPGLCYLGFLFVTPERWGEGIGSQLLETVLEDAARRGFERIHLMTHENNDRAHAMYLRRGFTRTDRHHPSGNDPDVHVEEWVRSL